MKKLLTISILLCMYAMPSISQESESDKLKEIRQKQIANIHSPELWDMERMKNDIEPINEGLPVRYGAFPVPHYKSLGSYKGGGFVSNAMARSIPEYRIHVGEREIFFGSFAIGDSPFYKEEQRNKAFFTIITVIDTVSTENFALSTSKFISRNHPDYGGEGSIATKNDIIEFVAFTTPDKGSFAVVNMRLFHLEYGNIILIAPHKDGTLRSLQIQGSVPPGDKSFDYIKNEVLKKEEVIKFFSAEGVI